MKGFIWRWCCLMFPSSLHDIGNKLGILDIVPGKSERVRIFTVNEFERSPYPMMAD